MKSLERIKANYKGAAGTAAARYRESIPGIAWQAAAVDGQDLYEAQMRDSEVLARRAKNIAKVSDSSFQSAMEKKGAPVIASRMADAADKQAANFAPYKSAIEGVSLPDRTADAMTNIDQRLKPIVAVLVAKKKEIG